MKRGHWQILLAAVLFLLALGLTLYPVVSNWYIGRHQSRIQTEYREVLEQTDTAKLDSIREKAVAYNKTITPGAAEEAYSQASIRLAAEDYVNQLNVSGSGIMGYVEIPKIGADLPIYHGTGADSLDRGTGHLLGSSLPVGGESTHMKTYIYPQNLKAKPHLWLWGMRDFVILAIAALLSVVLLVHSGLLFPLAGALCFAFMTIRMEDTTVMDYLGYAVRHFVTSQKYYEWR